MKHIPILAATFALSFSSPTFAADVDDAAGCKMYGQIAGVMVDFMLPLTMQDFVNMMSGKDPETLAKMSSGLISGLDGDDIKTMMALGGDAQIAGQAAGDVAVKTLMSGEATSSSEVKSIMESHCNEIGFDQILANQKRANQASAGNIAP